MKTNAIVLIVAAAALAAGAFFANTTLKQDQPPSKPSVAFFKDLAWNAINPPAGQQGASIAGKDWKGKIVVLNFWATWCAPCIQEMPELSRTYSDLRLQKNSKDLVIVGIGIDSESKIREFNAKTAIDYPLVVAGFSAVDWLRVFGNDKGALPYTVVFDQTGKVAFEVVGEINFAEFTPKIRQLLAK
jgi:thiol-disulfide isomerase/thioredoxin